MQFQQIAVAKGGARAEAATPVAGGRERTDGQVAVCTTMRGACVRDKEVAGGSKLKIARHYREIQELQWGQDYLN